jgi:hypothetical protein
VLDCAAKHRHALEPKVCEEWRLGDVRQVLAYRHLELELWWKGVDNLFFVEDTMNFVTRHKVVQDQGLHTSVEVARPHPGLEQSRAAMSIHCDSSLSIENLN